MANGAGVIPSTSSLERLSDGDRCQEILMCLLASSRMKLDTNQHPEDVAKWMAELADDINAEIKQRGWTE